MEGVSIAHPLFLLRRDYNRLRFFDLAERDGPGWWRPTSKGIQFSNDKIAVPCKVRVLDAEVIWKGKRW